MLTFNCRKTSSISVSLTEFFFFLVDQLLWELTLLELGPMVDECSKHSYSTRVSPSF